MNTKKKKKIIIKSLFIYFFPFNININTTLKGIKKLRIK